MSAARQLSRNAQSRHVQQQSARAQSGGMTVYPDLRGQVHWTSEQIGISLILYEGELYISTDPLVAANILKSGWQQGQSLAVNFTALFCGEFRVACNVTLQEINTYHTPHSSPDASAHVANYSKTTTTTQDDVQHKVDTLLGELKLQVQESRAAPTPSAAPRTACSRFAARKLTPAEEEQQERERNRREEEVRVESERNSFGFHMQASEDRDEMRSPDPYYHENHHQRSPQEEGFIGIAYSDNQPSNDAHVDANEGSRRTFGDNSQLGRRSMESQQNQLAEHWRQEENWDEMVQLSDVNRSNDFRDDEVMQKAIEADRENPRLNMNRAADLRDFATTHFDTLSSAHYSYQEDDVSTSVTSGCSSYDSVAVVDRSPVPEPKEKESNSKLHKLLNKWYNENNEGYPGNFNKKDYPFAVGGFVCPTVQNGVVTIYTRRLGPITINDNMNRRSQAYAYFMCTGPRSFKALEFERNGHPSFKSTKYVNADLVECKGYALMGIGERERGESSWWAWNDHTGLMRCKSSSARILKKKYIYWQPTLQMIMFDGSSSNGGKTWEVKTVSFIDHGLASDNNYWPQQAYFLPDLKKLPAKDQRSSHEVLFYSKTIDDVVAARLQHIREPENGSNDETVYGGIVVTVWHNDGREREFRSIATADCSVWNDRSDAMKIWRTTSEKLYKAHWYKDQ